MINADEEDKVVQDLGVAILTADFAMQVYIPNIYYIECTSLDGNSDHIIGGFPS